VLVVTGRCVAELLFQYRLGLTRTRIVLGVTRRARSQTVATFRPAAHVISWAGVLAHRHRRRHFVLVSVMQSMIGLKDWGVTIVIESSRAADESARLSRSIITLRPARSVVCRATTASALLVAMTFQRVSAVILEQDGDFEIIDIHLQFKRHRESRILRT